MFQSRKVKVHLNKFQKELVHRNFGASRFLWNWGLERLNKWWEENKDTPKDQRPKRPSAFDLGNEIRKLKKEDSNFMWLNECDSQIPKFVFDNLSKAFQRFWSHSASYPKFKSKKELRQSYSSVSPTVPRLEDGNHLRLAKLGRVKFYNKGYIPDVKLKRATLSTDGIDYYCSVLFDYPVESLPLVNKEVGIDLGLKSTVTCSDGKVFCWNPLKRSLRRIKLSQRHFSRCHKGSKRRTRAKIALAKRNRRLMRQHTDFIHKMTSFLVRENQAIRMETLNTKGMMKNHHLARSIGEQSFYEIRRQLEYKCVRAGRTFELVDPWYPSSQLCSCCGERHRAMKDLSKRTFKCPFCGYTADRDLNAALNILKYCTDGESETYARGDSSSLETGRTSGRLASCRSENHRNLF